MSLSTTRALYQSNLNLAYNSCMSLTEKKNWLMFKLFQNPEYIRVLDQAINLMVNYSVRKGIKLEDMKITTIVDKQKVVRATCK